MRAAQAPKHAMSGHSQVPPVPGNRGLAPNRHLAAPDGPSFVARLDVALTAEVLVKTFRLIGRSLLVLCASAACATAQSTPSDTIRLEVGSSEVDGRSFAPHRARVLVRLGAPDGPVVADWINELTVGDSAGRMVHRWVTTGTQRPVNGPTSSWEIRQTFDARTQAPLGYHRTSSGGADVRLVLDGTSVTGQRKLAAQASVEAVSHSLDKRGYVASASDLVPLAMTLKPGLVIVAPMWSPASPTTESVIFTVVGQEPRNVEGHMWNAWRVEERRARDLVLTATWFLVQESPYMVAGEVVQPNGQLRYMTEVAVP